MLGVMCCALLTLRVDAAPLRVLVDTSASMPYARFEGGELQEGLSRDLGIELARRLGREVQFVPVARKRLTTMLQAGQADLVCGYARHWLSGPFQWSRPMAHHEDILITRADAPAPRRLSDVADQAVGTIAGFRYSGAERQLGTRFVRDDGPDAQALLRRLAAKRISHAIVSRSYLEFQRSQGLFTLAMHTPLLVDKVALRCALSQDSELHLTELDEALSAMQKDGFLSQQR